MKGLLQTLTKPLATTFLLVAICLPISLLANVIFDGSPGTAAPPSTLGPYAMVSFGDDTRPTVGDVTSVPSPTGGNLMFDQTMSHRELNLNGWTANWSSGYNGGDVYWTGTGSGSNVMTMTLPAGTSAFYFYAQPNASGSYSVEAMASDGSSSGPINITGGATNGNGKYFGFYVDSPCCTLTSIKVTLNGSSLGFAVGQFGINGTCVLFDGSPGTAAPPANLGPFAMTSFGADNRPLFDDETTVPSPLGGDLTFSTAMNHRRIGNGWATWSHGYTGDVYATFDDIDLVITLPAGTKAFYLYAEPNDFGTHNITATSSDGTTSGPIEVVGNSGAKYYGFYISNPNCTLTSITVDAETSADGFAIGEFGIANGEVDLACFSGSISFNGELKEETANLIDLAVGPTVCGNDPIIDIYPPYITCEDVGQTVSVQVTATDPVLGTTTTCTTFVEVDGFPCGFMEAQVGCDNGDADYDAATETFSLEATDCLYGNPFTSDEFSFVKAELCGDGEIIAYVADLTSFGWAGITMRESLEPGSRKVSLSRDNGYLARRESRTTTNGMAYPQQFPAFGKNWLRLVRQGFQIIGYVSPNGISWQQVMVVNMNLPECIYVGLILTNKLPNQTITADFQNVEVNEYGGGGALQQMPEITQVEVGGKVSVYPNPTAGLTTVDLGLLMDKEVSMELMNSNGQTLRQLNLGRINDRHTELELGDLPAGVYWLRIQANDETPITERIVVQRP